MATFTDEQKANLVDILEIDIITLDERLTYRADNITEAIKTKALAWVTVYTTGTVSTDTTRILGLEANFGADIDPNRLRALIKRKLAVHLFCTDLINAGGSRVVRIP
jgi:hypothetical protein